MTSSNNEHDMTVLESESEDDDESSQESEEFNFAVALQLRKNLTETFDKHVHSSNISEKIARFETNNAAASQSNKPPRPHKPNASAANGAAAATGTTTSSKSTALGVYLRVRPVPTEAGNKQASAVAAAAATTTLEIQPTVNKSDVATMVRTFPPVDSNAAKVVRDSFSESSGGVKEFEFTQVFGANSSQQQVYSTIAAPLVSGLFSSSVNAQGAAGPTSSVSGALLGESALLFAYGITNAGKTHTIMGDVKGKKEGMGIIPRTFQDIFTHMEERRNNGNVKYDLHLSYMEIYNEGIYDLLPVADKEKSSYVGGVKPKLKLREGRDGTTFVRGVAKHRVQNAAHGLQLAQQASAKRHTSSNNINAESSRSHCICQLELSVQQSTSGTVAAAAANNHKDDDDDAKNGYTTDDEASRLLQNKHKTVTLWIVDLAGSERSKRTGVMQGSVRQKEAALINSSLMKLMRCLSVMRRNQSMASSSAATGAAAANIVPFRESKLTHLFMNHLTGPSANRTLMIVNVNPSAADFDETQHVLAYATAARTVQISQDEVNRKRKDMGGGTGGGDYMEATHDYNGRALKRFKSSKEPTAKTASTSAAAAAVTKQQPKNNKIAKLVRRFSPKKMPSKKTLTTTSSAPIDVSADAANQKELKKRKLADDGRASARSTTSSQLQVASDAVGEPSKPKTARLANMRAQGKPKNDESSQLNASKEKELKQLKTTLSIAQAEAEVLRSEKAQLEEHLSQHEAQVRMEIAQDMEEQMRVMREQYDSIIDNLKAQVQSAPTPAKSVKKAQKDKAETMVEELMDKVDECEDEMKRMRQAHAEEVACLQEEHDKVMQAKDQALGQLTSSSKKEISKLASTIEDLKAELAGLREDHVKLEKSKQDMMENYEKLIREEDDEDESSDEEEVDDEDEESDPTPVRRGREEKETARPLPRSRNSKVAVQVLEVSNGAAKASGKKPVRRVRSKRTPFSPVPINENQVLAEDSSDDSFGPDKWLRPRKPVERDAATGSFLRPRGRAPSGREWDENVGAWRLSIAG